MSGRRFRPPCSDVVRDRLRNIELPFVDRNSCQDRDEALLSRHHVFLKGAVNVGSVSEVGGKSRSGRWERPIVFVYDFTVLDDEEPRGPLRLHISREFIQSFSAPAGLCRVNHGKFVLCRRGRTCPSADGRHRGSAGGQMQKFATGNFHDAFQEQYAIPGYQSIALARCRTTAIAVVDA
jgi:hypothetical protein